MGDILKATAIIQARMGSTRLPNKVLLKLQGKTILEHVVTRALQAAYVDNVVVATTVDTADLKIVRQMSEKGISLYCGARDDVLDRFYQAARLFDAKHVVRITADCPVLDPNVIDLVVSRYFDSGADFCSNAMEETFPDGQDVEVFSCSALEKAWQNATLHSEREHVTPYIKKHVRQFMLVNCSHQPNWGHYRWTVDEEADYLFMQALYDALYRENPTFGMEQIVRFLKNNSDIQEINQKIKRNEGYRVSLQRDGQITSLK